MKIAYRSMMICVGESQSGHYTQVLSESIPSDCTKEGWRANFSSVFSVSLLYFSPLSALGAQYKLLWFLVRIDLNDHKTMENIGMKTVY